MICSNGSKLGRPNSTSNVKKERDSSFSTAEGENSRIISCNFPVPGVTESEYDMSETKCLIPIVNSSIEETEINYSLNVDLKPIKEEVVNEHSEGISCEAECILGGVLDNIQEDNLEAEESAVSPVDLELGCEVKFAYLSDHVLPENSSETGASFEHFSNDSRRRDTWGNYDGPEEPTSLFFNQINENNEVAYENTRNTINSTTLDTYGIFNQSNVNVDSLSSIVGIGEQSTISNIILEGSQYHNIYDQDLKINLVNNESESRELLAHEEIPYQYPPPSSLDGNQKGNLLQCSHCGKYYRSKQGLKRHLLLFTQEALEKKFRCELCGKNFNTKYNLNNHISLHKSEKEEPEFSCQDCGKMFHKKQHLQCHVKVHSGQRDFHCTTCGKAFTESGSLKRHMALHIGKKPYVCKICNKSFPVKGYLTLHLRDNHRNKEPRFFCSHCDKSFLHKVGLVYHTRSHTLDKPYRCEFCMKSFASNSSLKLHLKIHLGLRDFVCHLCGKAFYDKKHLRDHIRTHEAEREGFQCNLCGKSYSTSTSLRTHKRFIHSEVKERFICEHCGIILARKECLVRHVKIHFESNRFRCKICYKSYTLQSSLVAHTILHNKQSPYQCDRCERSYTLQKDFIRHWATHS